ncbi:hypothetical protein ACVWYV_002001 [Pantoea eucalypti]
MRKTSLKMNEYAYMKGVPCAAGGCQDIEKRPDREIGDSLAALQIIHLAQSVKGFNRFVLNVADRPRGCTITGRFIPLLPATCCDVSRVTALL